MVLSNSYGVVWMYAYWIINHAKHSLPLENYNWVFTCIFILSFFVLETVHTRYLWWNRLGTEMPFRLYTKNMQDNAEGILKMVPTEWGNVEIKLLFFQHLGQSVFLSLHKFKFDKLHLDFIENF